MFRYLIISFIVLFTVLVETGPDFRQEISFFQETNIYDKKIVTKHWNEIHEELRPHEVSLYIGHAADYINAPLEWSEDSNLLNLVKNESKFKPFIKNSNSSAFGLFQMVESTWNIYIPEVPYGIKDPFWQCVGGLRYLMKVYHTPQRAYSFYQATVRRDVTLAPLDLQNKAQIWITNGIHGY